MLHKARIDNMTDYIQRKMERISQGRQGNRPTTVAPSGECKPDNGSSEEPVEKKPKTDS